MFKLGMYIGTVKEDASDGLNNIAGMKLVLLTEPFNPDNYLIVSPTTIEDFEKYYHNAFEIMGKKWISEDYKEFVRYMIDPDCEIINSTSKNNFENVIKFTKEDDEVCYKSICEFKEKYLNDGGINSNDI